jgi:hypothetical protein
LTAGEGHLYGYAKYVGRVGALAVALGVARHRCNRNPAEYLVPTHVRGLQYLDTPSMIQTGLIPLHPGAMDAYRALHG